MFTRLVIISRCKYQTYTMQYVVCQLYLNKTGRKIYIHFLTKVWSFSQVPTLFVYYSKDYHNMCAEINLPFLIIKVEFTLCKIYILHEKQRVFPVVAWQVKIPT